MYNPKKTTISLYLCSYISYFSTRTNLDVFTKTSVSMYYKVVFIIS